MNIFATDLKCNRLVTIDQVYFYNGRLFVRFRNFETADAPLRSIYFATMKELEGRFHSELLRKHVLRLLGRTE